MGGRGASSGMSHDKYGKLRYRYGTEYSTVHQSGNIKFIKKNVADAELFETRTKGRVYAEVSKNEVKSIHYFDNDLKKSKTIDLTHYHKKMKPHVHHGYFHNENDNSKGATRLSKKEKKMVDFVIKEWYNTNSK
ncbi:putative uncharacterized protein [Ruminococcus sp. CAG:563]|nr:putative uncharacterized protein [Ruminococcus sp. CAG:563]